MLDTASAQADDELRHLPLDALDLPLCGHLHLVEARDLLGELDDPRPTVARCLLERPVPLRHGRLQPLGEARRLRPATSGGGGACSTALAARPVVPVPPRVAAVV